MSTCRVYLFLLSFCLISNLTLCNYYNYNQGNGGGRRRQQQPRPKKKNQTDYYEIQGLPKRSDYKTVKKTFKKLALQLHPDKVIESERESAKERFEKITEAYDILSDSEKKSAYDSDGFDGLEEYNENDQMRQQRKAQKEQYEDQRKEQEKHSDQFEESDVTSLSISSLTRFYRRINVWQILFYVGDEQHAKRLQPAYKELATKYNGIFEVAAINCAEEEEICEEFKISVINNDTPSLFLYKADDDISEGRKLENDNVTLGALSIGKMAMAAVNIMDDFVSIVTDDNYADYVSKQSKGNRSVVLLFTDKTLTSPLFKALSKEFKNSVSFGLVKKSSNKLIEKFAITEFPKVMIVKNMLDYTGDFLEETINKDSIVKFIRKDVQEKTSGDTKNKVNEIKELTVDNYSQGFCGSEDKVTCVQLVVRVAEEYMEILENVIKSFGSDNMNFFIINRENLELDNIVDQGHWQNYEKTSKDDDEFVEVLVIKGAKQRYSYSQGSGDEESLKNYVDLMMSQPFKRMKEPLSSAFLFEHDVDDDL